MPKKNSAPLTKGDFDEAMGIIAKAFEKVATKDDIQGVNNRIDRVEERLGSLEERMGRVERVQEAMLKTLESIEGRLKDPAFT